MITVVATVSLLIALGTLMFQRYDRSFRAEAQTRLILAELMKARMNAITQHRGTRVKLYRDRFEVYSSASERREGVDPIMVQSLNFPITKNFSGAAEEVEVDFKETGFTDSWGSICVDIEGTQPALNSIVISATSIRSGVKEMANDCVSPNITFK